MLEESHLKRLWYNTAGQNHMCAFAQLWWATHVVNSGTEGELILMTSRLPTGRCCDAAPTGAFSMLQLLVLSLKTRVITSAWAASYRFSPKSA